MNVPRETIFAALFALAADATLGTAPAFAYTSRHIVAPANTPTLPALFQKQDDQMAKQGTYGLTRWDLRAWWVIYLRNNPAREAVNSTPLNTYMDLAEALLAPLPPGDVNQLGPRSAPLVANCFIDGKVIVDENPLGDAATIIIPISIVTGI